MCPLLRAGREPRTGRGEGLTPLADHNAQPGGSLVEQRVLRDRRSWERSPAGHPPGRGLQEDRIVHADASFALQHLAQLAD